MSETLNSSKITQEKVEPSESSLLKALEENWKHARHEEEHRSWHLNIFITVMAGVLTVIFTINPSFDKVLINYWPLFGVLALFSRLIFQSVTKENAEFSNHIVAIQWIAEKLFLNTKKSPQRQKIIDTLLSKGVISEKEIKDSMFQGYMALPLPLPLRVHKVFHQMMHIIIFGTSVSFVVGFLLFIFQILSIPSTNAYAIASFFGMFLGICIFFINRKTIKITNDKAKMIMDLRQPEGIKIRYQETPEFWNEYNN